VKPCDICLEKECKAKGGVGTCNCSTCKMEKECPRKLRATIRITLKCTQSCRHCCYESSPEKEVHMSIDSAKKIAEFLTKNEVHSVNLMGGEIFCNPDWREILDIIIPTVKYARIVSNGDWAVSETGMDFAKHVSKHPNAYIVVSKDQWHTNANIEKAEKLIIENNVLTKTSDLKETEFSLVPVGRAEYSDSLYSMFSCWCHNPEHQYSFLIDEVGSIFKCGFGVWDYACVDDYLEGGFAERFKEFNKIFYGTFISSCSRCNMSYKFHGK
jgi:hypothetical protein